VQVLEARDRIGGRVFSHTLPNGLVVDLGAQFIGPRQPRINALATQSGAKLIQLNSKGRTIREPASSLSIINRLQVAKLAWRLNKEARATPADTPWTRNRANELDSVSCTDWLASNASPAAASVWVKLARNSFCMDPHAISALEAFQHFSIMGGLLGLATAEISYFENGAVTIADYLAQELTVLTHAAVQSVKVNNELVHVKLADKTLCANQVVLAVPPQIGCHLLSTTDANTIGYIENATIGEVVKTAIIYSSAWWKDTGMSGNSSSDNGPVSLTYDGTPPGANFGCLIAISCADHASALPQDEHTRCQSIISHTHRLLGNKTHEPLYSRSIDWGQEPESLGGFSSVRKPGAWIKRASSPSSTNSPIHCAGTEFAVEWRSYMEGALESGERAAANVLNALNS